MLFIFIFTKRSFFLVPGIGRVAGCDLHPSPPRSHNTAARAAGRRRLCPPAAGGHLPRSSAGTWRPPAPGTAAPQLGPAAHTGRKRKIEKKKNREKNNNSKVAGFLSGKQAGAEWDSSVGRRERGVPWSPLGASPSWEWPGRAVSSFTPCVGRNSLFQPSLGQMGLVLLCMGQGHLWLRDPYLA